MFNRSENVHVVEPDVGIVFVFEYKVIHRSRTSQKRHAVYDSAVELYGYYFGIGIQFKADAVPHIFVVIFIHALAVHVEIIIIRRELRYFLFPAFKREINALALREHELEFRNDVSAYRRKACCGVSVFRHGQVHSVSDFTSESPAERLGRLFCGCKILIRGVVHVREHRADAEARGTLIGRRVSEVYEVCIFSLGKQRILAAAASVYIRLRPVVIEVGDDYEFKFVFVFGNFVYLFKTSVFFLYLPRVLDDFNSVNAFVLFVAVFEVNALHIRIRKDFRLHGNDSRRNLIHLSYVCAARVFIYIKQCSERLRKRRSRNAASVV